MNAQLDYVTKWYLNAKIGDVTLYHTGLLGRDRLRKKATADRAAAFLDLSDLGVVRLFQKRVDVDRMICEYLAQKVK